MELEKAMLERRSIRKFTDRPIKEENIDKLLRFATSGPSARNVKPYSFYVIEDKKTQERIKSILPPSNYNCPLQIVVVGETGKYGSGTTSGFWVQDCASVTTLLLLEVTELGLGAVWCGLYPKDEPVKEISELLRLDASQIPFCVIDVGYPDEEKEARDQFEPSMVHRI